MAAVRRLEPPDAAAFFELRRAALLDTPWAFLSSPEDDVARDIASVEAMLTKPEHAVFGAFDQPGGLVAIAGVFRQSKLKARHRGEIWGVFCAPSARGQGHGRAVTSAAIEHARSWPGVEIVQLSASERTPGAIALYRSLGFEPWGTEPDAMRIGGVGHAEVHMQLRL